MAHDFTECAFARLNGTAGDKQKWIDAGTSIVHALDMPTFIDKPTRIEAAGNKPKLIEEYVGRVNSRTEGISVARMRSPGGWVEPGQRPDFDEYTVVLRGVLRVEHESGAIDVAAGQAIITHKGEWVRYSTPGEDGAEYVAVCLPGFSPDTVHRDESSA